MKKITINLFLMLLMFATFNSFAQTLNQNASWPNGAWSVTGTYNTDPLAFEADPTTTANFAFDDDDAGSGSDDSIAAESPVIDLTAASGAGETWLRVSGVYVYRFLTNDELKFQYWDADGMTWVDWGFGFTSSTDTSVNDDFCTGTTDTYTSSVLDISGFTATQLSGFRYRISYDDDPAGADFNWGFCFQSPTITSEAPPACLDPSMLGATNLMETSAELSWTENGTAMAWDVEIVNISAMGTPTGTPTASGVANPYTAMGLTASTNYEFYVRADCGGAGTSNWVGPFAFSTACGTFMAPYSEDFETFTTSTSPFVDENCWTGNSDPGNTGSMFWEAAPGTDTSSSGTGPSPTITTGNYFFTEASGSAAGDETNLISPMIDLSGLTTPALSFDYHMHGVLMGTLTVLVNGTDNVWSLSGEQQAAETDPFISTTIDLSAYAGQTIFVTFNGVSGGDWESDMAIDNVLFDELPTCTSAVVASSTTVDDCGNAQFFVDIDITTVGDATQINDGTNTFAISGTGVLQVGPYASGATVTLDVEHSDPACDFSLGNFSFSCPPPNDLFADAIAISCGNSVLGSTISATQDEATAPDTATVEADTAADNDSPWVWYSFTGSGAAERITLSTCNPGSDFDTEIFVYTGTSGALTCIDDGYDECGSPDFFAETSFDSDGTTTYYIAIGGWNAANVGNFELSVSCATLSIDDVADEAAFTYYPNPVKNTLTLNAQNNIDNVTMYNMLGQEVLRANPNNVDSNIDMSGLQTGTYFVKVTIANITKTIRVIKQ